MPKPPVSQLVGIAGVHHVASFITYLGFHAVPTTRNVAGPDILVSSLDGSRGVTLQVKTTSWAMRTRGRGDKKRPHHYEWDIGWNSARINLPGVYFALVDLKELDALPDVFVVPSRVIFQYFKGGDPKTWTRARYHPPIVDIEHYKNSWKLLTEELETRA